MSDYCQPCSLDFDYILRVEDLGDDQPVFSRIPGPPTAADNRRTRQRKKPIPAFHSQKYACWEIIANFSIHIKIVVAWHT